MKRLLCLYISFSWSI